MATKVLSTITLIGKDTRKVVKMSGTFKYDKESQMAVDFPAGYHRYRYNGVVFTVPVDDKFHDALDAGKLQEVIINQVEDKDDPTITRYQYDTCVSKQAYLEDAMFDAQLDAIAAGRGTTSVLSAEEVEDMA
jgi:hypothetical protein